MYWNSGPRIRCLVEPSAGLRGASEPPVDAACVKDIGNGGMKRGVRRWSGSPCRPIRGGGGDNPTSAAGCPVAVTALPVAACAGCTRNDGNEPGAPAWRDGWPNHSRSSSQRRARPAASRIASSGRRARLRSAKPTPIPGRVNGRPDIDEFADRFAAETPLASEQIRLDRLTGQLKLELQYVLQRRHDDRQGKLTPDVVMRVVKALAAIGVGSCSTTTRTSGTTGLGRRSMTLAPVGSSATHPG